MIEIFYQIKRLVHLPPPPPHPREYGKVQRAGREVNPLSGYFNI
jgi:hypothetical protein